MGLWYDEIWHSFGYIITCSRNQGKKVTGELEVGLHFGYFPMTPLLGFSICSWPSLSSRALFSPVFCSCVCAFSPGTTVFYLERNLCGPQRSRRNPSICQWKEREQGLRRELIVLWEELSTAVIVDMPEGKKEATDLTPIETTRTKGKKLQS